MNNFLKALLYDSYQLITDFVMHIPISNVRFLYCRIVMPSIGHGTQISRHVHFISPHKIVLGNNVFINRNATLDGRKGLEIEDNVDIGEFSSIWSLQHDYNDPNHATIGGKTVIKDHSWIAPHSIILPGIEIGRGTVVATQAVVTKNTPAHSIMAGIPAKQIAERKNPLQYKLTYKIIF